MLALNGYPTKLDYIEFNYLLQYIFVFLKKTNFSFVKKYSNEQYKKSEINSTISLFH